ncbi:MAG: hypothetical protein K2Q10_08805 [Rhodospirillales bacterium]|nr:hypothetical protein [Rhodospirillales bacterium]
MSARNVEQEFDALKSDFSKLSSDLASLTDAIRNLTGQDAQDYLAKMRAVVGQANEGVEATASALGARGREGIASVAQHMRERPLTSILICLGLGVVIGKLIDR